MAVSYLAVSTVCMFTSFLGLQWWAQVLVGKFKDDGLTVENFTGLDNASQLLDLLLSSSATVLLLATFIVSVFTLLVLLLKTFFFGVLSSSETRKLLERLVNYVIYKGTFLPLVLPPTLFHLGLWSTWLTVLCTLKMFQDLARDRLERLNASPMTTPWVYFQVYSVLLAALTVDVFWIRMSLIIHRALGSSVFLLLLFEPFSVAFEILQAMVVHGFQLLDIWVHHSAAESSCRISKFIDTSAVGAASLPCYSTNLSMVLCSALSVVAEVLPRTLLLDCVSACILLYPFVMEILCGNLCSLLEWKSFLIRNLGFLLDMATLLTTIGHYAHIWLLRGMPLHFVDVVLFLNIRTLLSAIVKRIKGYIKLKMALDALHAALPDATSEELQAYDDECAICREPMTKAKRLHCNHLFHLGCLRSWLDQGLNEVYSCPTCRKAPFVPSPENEASMNNEVSADEQLTRRLSSGLDGLNPSGVALPGGLFPNQAQIPLDGSAWRNPELNTNWLSQSVDGAGPSTSVRSGGLSRVQLMMRHLASVGESYTQSALDDAAWGLWPANISQPATSVGGLPGSIGGLHVRRASRSTSDDITNIFSMAETVWEVLPHVPDEIIFQDLLRTNSVTVTVNNLLQM